jgi:hypothetical protein
MRSIIFLEADKIRSTLYVHAHMVYIFLCCIDSEKIKHKVSASFYENNLLIQKIGIKATSKFVVPFFIISHDFLLIGGFGTIFRVIGAFCMQHQALFRGFLKGFLELARDFKEASLPFSPKKPQKI